VFVTGDITKQDRYVVTANPMMKAVTAIRLEALPDERLPGGGPGMTYYEGNKGDFFLTEFRPKGMTFVAINPNHPDGLSIDELGYSKYNDGFEDMKKYAADEGFDFPYLYDGETQSVAKAYGCLATPHVFVFDAERKLRYKGRFDESQYGGDDSTIKSPDTRNAVKALLAAGANPNAKAPDGSTPLHQAVAARQVEIIRALVAAGAKLDAVDRHNETPLLLAEKPEPPPPQGNNTDARTWKPKRDSREDVIAALRQLMGLGPNDPTPQPPPEPVKSDDKKPAEGGQ
jgi:hypothetical protein